ncbi:MAG: nucleotidyltransferase family protein [Armatimonadetes bacterium]|nr:nucleotidyltransferase family protein [Armatimonadota bacterium]
MTTPLCAVLLAGGRIMDADGRYGGIKANLTFEGMTLLGRAMATARDCPAVGAVAVVGPPDLRSEIEQAGNEWLSAASTGTENLAIGLQWAQRRGSRRALVLTTDLPFVAPEHLTAFLKRMPADAQAYGGALTKEAYEARFPGTNNTYTRLADGRWAPACAYVADVAALQAALPIIERIFEGRKNPLKIVSVLGFGVLLRMLTGRLTTTDILGRVEQITGLRCAMDPNAPPELAADVDTEEDLESARRAAP